MFKRIKNLWNLSQYKPSQESVFDFNTKENVSKVTLQKDEPEVKAEFFTEGSEEEYKEFEREQQGIKGIFGIGKND